LSRNVLAQFVKLHRAALVRGADARVDGDDHGPMNAQSQARKVALES
jgi:hypothetical protein